MFMNGIRKLKLQISPEKQKSPDFRENKQFRIIFPTNHHFFLNSPF